MTSIIRWIIGWIGGGFVFKYIVYQLGRKTQKDIDINAQFEMHKTAEEIAARPAGSIDDVIDRT